MHARELMGRLEHEFGLGQIPMARMRLYSRLAMAAERDPRVLVVVRAVAVEARTKKSPGHWFCRSVCLRLDEFGLAIESRGGTPVRDICGQVFTEGGA